MKNIFFILISVLFFSSCTQNHEIESVNNDNINNDLAKFNLKGRVKSFRETKFLAVNNFSIVEHGEKKKHLYNNELLFNLDGNKIEKNDYLPDGTLANRTMYLYKDNKLVEYSNYDPEGLPFGVGKYEYDDNGHINKLVDNTTDGRNNWTQTYEYDQHGNLVEVKQFKSEELIEREEKYNYNDNGEMVESNFFKENNLIAKNNHIYDKDGDIIQLNYSNTSTYTFKYSYDFKGNWVKKIVFVDDNPSGILIGK